MFGLYITPLYQAPCAGVVALEWLSVAGGSGFVGGVRFSGAAVNCRADEGKFDAEQQPLQAKPQSI